MPSGYCNNGTPNKGWFKKGQISQAPFKKGYKPIAPFKKGCIPWNKGKIEVYSKETLKKMRKARIGKPAWNKDKHPNYVQGEKNPAWKGGKRIHNGYYLVYKSKHPFRNKDNYIYEHRLIMEKYLKRFLNSKEIVHHINKNTLDNRIGNLILFKNQIFHCWFHRKGDYTSKGIIFDGRHLASKTRQSIVELPVIP